MSKLSRKNQTKNKRENEEKIRIPEALSSITLPRNIDLETFTQARILELEHFLSILNDKAAVGGRMGTKKSFQLLPKHMRRRAMSHNSHRIPSRIRHLAQNYAYLKNPCRKTRRHSKQIIKDYYQRNSKSLWLETHIWHAKRMKMAALWGYKIAMNCNDKGIRASYRFMRHSAVAYDSSYFSGFIIKNPGLLNLKSKPGFSNESLFFFNNQLICPIETFLACSGTVVIVHPAAADQLKNIFLANGIEFVDIRNQLSIFKIRGSKSSEILNKVLDVSETNAKKLIASAARIHNFKLQNGAIVSVNVKKIMYKKIREDVQISKDRIIPYQPDSDLLNFLFDWPNDFYLESFWNQFKQEDKVSHAPDKITTRSAKSRYPLSRVKAENQNIKTKNLYIIPEKLEKADEKLEKADEKLEKADEKLEKTEEKFEKTEEKFEKTDEKFEKTDEKFEKTEETDEKLESAKTIEKIEPPTEVDKDMNEETVEALLVYRKNEFGDGWDLILKSEDNAWLWRSLIYAGAKAVGLKEFSSISYEQGHLFFPNDYPTTQSYIESSLSLAKESLNSYFKKPSSKRMNFERIGSPYPFYSDWGCGVKENIKYTDLISIEIKCFKRSPKPLTYLCMPEENDLVNTNYKEPLQNRKKNNSQMELTDVDDLRLLKVSRKIIGFITSGGFSFARSKGYGIGYILADFQSFIGKKILFRNPTSQFYHICKLNKLKF